MDLLKPSFKNNDFIFNDDWYLQISGTAMGKKLPQIMQTYSWLNGRKKHLKRYENNH